MDLLPDGLTARPPTMDDVEAVVALLREDEAAVSGGAITTVGDIASDWARPSVDLATHAVLVHDGARLVGYADQHRGRAWAAVAPGDRGRGIGTALLAWTEASARGSGQGVVGQTVADMADPAKQLLAANGYTPRWHSWVFSIPLGEHIAPPVLPQGVAVRPMQRPQEDHAVHEVIQTAFGEWPDRNEPTPFEDWRVAHLERDDVEVLVALVDDVVVGAAVCLDEGEGEGWVEQLAVDRGHRGQGLARALLQQAFHDFAVRGCTTAGLSTDSRTGAKALYEHVGMVVTSTWTRWARDLTDR